jgi:hypothetical protein
MITERQTRVQRIIDSGDIEKIKSLLTGLCACVGPRNGEPLCPCRMTEKQIRDHISLFMLKRGKLVRLKH